MPWEWLTANFLTVVLSVGLAVLGIIGGIVVALTFYLKSKKSLEKLRKEVMAGLVAVSKGEVLIYQDGLPELEDKKKLRLIRDGLKATEKFKHNKAIKKFQKALTRATIPS
ncbi:MAG: hypothetical protein U9Q76_00655, partial [candidate division WOR-3 bacterium]|nr:hypothetical protein [candidate division WOR-3 bacterium]